MPEEDKPTEKEKIYVTLPANAIIREVPGKNFAVFNMPKTGSLSGYRYLVNLNVIERSEDGEAVTFPLKDKTTIKKNGEADTLSANMMKTFLSGTTEDDYKDEDFQVFIPMNAVYSRYEKVTRVLMPPASGYRGLFSVLPNSCLDEGKSTEDGEMFVLHDWMRIKIRTKDGTDAALSAKDFAKIMSAGADSYPERIKWLSVTVPQEAVINRYDKQTHLHMPKGDYEGYAYYIPNGMAKSDGKGDLRLVIPETRSFTIRNLTDEKKTLTAEEMADLLKDKTAEDYLRISKEEIDGFVAKAAELKEKLPADLLKSDCWVDVRVKKDAAGKSYFSTSISRHKAGRADAEIKGVAFEEVEEYGKIHGADTFAYAFDGKGIVCISVNDSFDDKGALTEKAQKILLSAKDTYAERSASGKDIHIFGIVGGVDTEYISKDKSMELYYGADYLAMTGENITGAKSLAYFGESSPMGELIAENFAPAKDIPQMTKSDKETLDKAVKAEKGGEDFTALYNGENKKGTPEYCDENFMIRLACRTLGDTNAMRRIYNSSERKNRTKEHIDHLAMKTSRDTASFVTQAKKTFRKDGSQNSTQKTDDIKKTDTETK